jgi:8-oxo-dGTP pyrophosphatase MutT (NUDIX family)
MTAPTQIQAHIARRTSIDAHSGVHAPVEFSALWEFLVLQRADDEKVYPNLWQVVTGIIEHEPPETATQAAFREIMEETGLRPKELWVLPTITSFYSLSDNAIVHVPCFAGIVEPKAPVVLSSEHQAFEWLDYEQVLARLPMPSHGEGTRVLYERILTKIDTAPFRRISTTTL